MICIDCKINNFSQYLLLSYAHLFNVVWKKIQRISTFADKEINIMWEDQWVWWWLGPLYGYLKSSTVAFVVFNSFNNACTMEACLRLRDILQSQFSGLCVFRACVLLNGCRFKLKLGTIFQHLWGIDTEQEVLEWHNIETEVEQGFHWIILAPPRKHLCFADDGMWSNCFIKWSTSSGKNIC